MHNLIIKDIRLQKYWLLIGIVLICILPYGPLSVALGVYAFVTNYVVSAQQLDAKEGRSTYHKFLNSLPYSRQTIILSKYTGSLLASGVAVLVALLVQVPNYPLQSVQLMEIWVGLISAIVFASFYFPICYKFRNMYLPILFIFLFVGVLISWNKLDEWLGISSYVQNLIESVSIAELIVYTSIFTAIVYALSFLLTVKIYERTDF